ncbi:LysR family transcriptional regulator [Rhodovibrionaceae bacterium A322]
MSYQLPPLNWLRAFEAAARHGSFTAAAGELNLTQAAVSHQVRSLEQNLGFALFERLPRSLKLTHMGQAYLPSVRRAFDDLSASTVGLFGLMGKSTLVVRAPISFATACLAPRLHRFTEAYPNIEILFCSAIWADLMSADRADIDIRSGSGIWQGYNAILLDQETSIPVCAPQLAERLGGKGNLAAFSPDHMIHIMGCDDLWARGLKAAGADEADATKGVKVDTSLAAMEMAAAGLGAAFVLRSFAQAYLESGRLIRPVDLELTWQESHYLLLPDQENRHRPEVLLFKDWLLSEMMPG